MSQHQKDSFNIKRFSRDNSVARTTIKDTLDRMLLKGWIDYPHIGGYKINALGHSIVKAIQGVSEWGVGNARRECRDPAINLSQHYTRYTCRIKGQGFTEELLKKLRPAGYKKVPLPNMDQHVLYFDDATILIYPKKAVIRIHDIVAEDTEETNFETLSKAMNYSTKLINSGLGIDNLEMSSAHYGRVNSYLSDFLKKIDDRYFLDLGNGRKFWIDFSPGKEGEDETNDKDVRDRIDAVLADAVNSESLLSDVDKMKEVLGLLIKVKLIESVPNKVDELVPIEKANYFG